jgi:type IV secretion system protein VirB8
MFKKKKGEEKKPNFLINWYEDKYQSALVWRNWLFLITLISMGGVFVVCFILFMTVPLKSVSPFVIQIDEKSGFSEIVKGKTVKDYSAKEELIKFFAVSYVGARESFDLNSFQTNREIVRLMSSSDVFRNYAAEVSTENPRSPLNLFADHSTRGIDLVSFSFLDKNATTGESVVQARLRIREIGINAAPVDYFVVVTMSCYFENELTLNEKERLVNPLGFVITSYRVDRENT